MSSSGSSMTVATRRLGRTFGPGWILSATPPAPRLKSPPTCWTHGCPDSCARRPWITNILSPPQIERPGRRLPSAARASPTRTAACDVESAASRPASKTTGPVRIPVETVRPKLTHRSRISGREPQRNMTIPEAAAPPGRGKDVLVEFPQDELIAKWEEFFEEMGYLSKIIAIADRFPEDRSLLVAFDELNRFDTDMAIYLLRHPLTSSWREKRRSAGSLPRGTKARRSISGSSSSHGTDGSRFAPFERSTSDNTSRLKASCANRRRSIRESRTPCSNASDAGRSSKNRRTGRPSASR